MDSKRPFLDYYETLGTVPVRQDVRDIRAHFERREALYRLLGLPPRFFALAQVLEFGPGLGHNAIYVASLRPERYVLVDGSRQAIAGLRETLAKGGIPLDRVEIVESEARAFRSESLFDVVLAENMIPMQREPRSFCRAIASHVRPGGVLVITCQDSISYLGEILRRAVALKVASPELDLATRVRRLLPIFAPHLKKLPATTRPAEDWIADNVTHPLIGQFFSISDAIEALSADFEFYGGSPHFLTEWRWYKELFGAGRRFNEEATLAFESSAVRFIDWRLGAGAHEPEFGHNLRAACDVVWERVKEAEEKPAGGDFERIAAACAAVAAALESNAPISSAAIREVIAFLLTADEASSFRFDAFEGFFGRTQYVSFIRRASRQDEQERRG